VLCARARAAEENDERVYTDRLQKVADEKARLEHIKSGSRGTFKGAPPVYRPPFRPGITYERAKVGFFLQSTRRRDNRDAWHQWAACCFLVYNDYESSIDAFLEALKVGAPYIAPI
jgi:hypothetical protein